MAATTRPVSRLEEERGTMTALRRIGWTRRLLALVGMIGLTASALPAAGNQDFATLEAARGGGAPGRAREGPADPIQQQQHHRRDTRDRGEPRRRRRRR